ncbi:Protein FAR1-RELATED SEQUENCE [Arachis hypogaea]|nr:Protein FAR1-RELATED SEQUENCE [Arachis hypogaea]
MYCQQRSWNVAWTELDEEFTCSCLQMESFGIPCVHILGVLVYLNITVIPALLILERWTKKAKQPMLNNVRRVGEIPNAAYISMHVVMLDNCRDLIRLSCCYFEDYFGLKNKIANERVALREKHRLRVGAVDAGNRLGVKDPLRARHKGCGQCEVTSKGKIRRVQ